MKRHGDAVVNTEVLGSNLPINRGLFSCVLFARSSCVCLGFLLQSKDMCIMFTEYFKLPIGVDVSVNSCLSLRV